MSDRIDFDAHASFGRKRGRASLSLLGLAMLLTAGCGNIQHIEVGSIPDDYRTRHPIVVDESQVAIDLPIVSSDTHLDPADKHRVEKFADRFRRSGADSIQVLLPSGSTNEYAAERISHEIVAILRKREVHRNAIFVQPYSTAGASGPVPIRLSYAALVAHTDPCGRWPDNLADTYENKNYFNFGCALQNNLAAQVADPRDLLSPRGMDPIDAGRRATVLDNYRRGQATQAVQGGGGDISSY